MKQQRLERERERQLRDDENEIMQREKEAEHFKVNSANQFMLIKSHMLFI